jgi:hypothetical protein
MGPLHTVHIPRLSRVMRGERENYLHPPLIQKTKPLAPPTITPWWYEGPTRVNMQGMGNIDFEYGGSMQPRDNPAFSDAWVIGATAGANRVVPQGIDYSRTPCCSAGMGDAGTTSLFVGLVGVPLLVFGIMVAGDVLGALALGGQSPRSFPRG